MSTRLGWAAMGAIAVRVLAALALILGPWTDEPSELEGWDVERFQEITDTAGAPYVDHAVEYPPLTVVIAKVVLDDDVVASHQRLVVLSLVVDLALAAVLARRFSPPAAATYLLIGLPLVPSGLLRLDLWAALAAVIAAAAITDHSPRSASARRSDPVAMSVFAVAVTVGAMIKLWPALLMLAAIGIRRWRDAGAAAAVGGIAGLVWLAISGTGAIEQITSLRGVTGWHLESIPGSLVALFGSEQPRLEADAFRIGDLNETVVLAGRVLTLAVAGAATLLAWSNRRPPSERLAMVMLVSVSALIVTAPLLSPQFLLWLTPWVALLHRERTTLWVAGSAVALTAVILAAFGPPDLDHPVAAGGLLVRDGLLIALIVNGLALLRRSDWFEYS